MNKKDLTTIGTCLITLSAIGAVICSSITIYLSTQVKSHVSSVQNDVTALSRAYLTQEQKSDDPQYVTISNSYDVRDTSAISDAYLKNNSSTLTTPEDKETLQLASDLLKNITTDEMSLYEKELAIHDWLVTNVSSPENSLSSLPTGHGPTFTPYGVLKYKKAVCVGYATTFKLLMNMAGAECMVAHNLSLSHTWDVVKLDDGQWYIVDVYTDASTYDTEKSNISHQDFNVTNDFINSGDPEFDTALYPVASSYKYSYAAQNSTKLTDIKTLPKTLKKLLKSGTAEVYYELPKDCDYKYIAALIQGINNRSIDGSTIDAQYVTVDKTTTILSLSFTYNIDMAGDERNYPDLSEELDKLFGSETLDAPMM